MFCCLESVILSNLSFSLCCFFIVIFVWLIKCPLGRVREVKTVFSLGKRTINAQPTWQWGLFHIHVKYHFFLEKFVHLKYHFFFLKKKLVHDKYHFFLKNLAHNKCYHFHKHVYKLVSKVFSYLQTKVYFLCSSEDCDSITTPIGFGISTLREGSLRFFN